MKAAWEEPCPSCSASDKMVLLIMDFALMKKWSQCDKCGHKWNEVVVPKQPLSPAEFFSSMVQKARVWASRWSWCLQWYYSLWKTKALKLLSRKE